MTTCAAQALTIPNLTVLRNLSSHDAQCLRATSEVGIFPTRVIPGFIETFCVAALEYEALGVPVLASCDRRRPRGHPGRPLPRRPGHDGGANGWRGSTNVLANRAERSAVAAAFAGKFTSARSAQRLIDLATLAADRLNRLVPLKADPVDDYLATWPARDSLHRRAGADVHASLPPGQRQRRVTRRSTSARPSAAATCVSSGDCREPVISTRMTAAASAIEPG